ncbi:MAG: endopeptidase La [bacterium]|nr:endopeptidase La [bacterium]MDD5756667.1 endopeptidase La [bacterium]
MYEEKVRIDLPTEVPILPVRDTVFYPFVVSPIIIGREKSIKLVEDALVKDKIIALFSQKDANAEDPQVNDLYDMGTVVLILKMLKFPDGSLRLIVQGLSRAKLKGIVQAEPYLKGRVEVLEEVEERSLEVQAMMRNVLSLFQKLVNLAPYLSEEVYIAAMNIESPNKLSDFVSSNLTLDIRIKQELLEIIDIKRRLERLTVYLTEELAVLELGSKIQSQVRTEVDRTQKEFFLRKQMEAIQRELGEGDEKTIELNELKIKIKEAKMPPEVEKEAERELLRLMKMPFAAAEYTVSRTYLDWLTGLPWSKATADMLDITKARQILDEDHYDLEKVKQRILEYLAVRKLRPEAKGPILCFIGPPGTGKTSLGRSIARALGRKFVRISLGGIRDEAEIRGHRRTYVGSLPGRIIQGIRRAESNNPVFMLDEIDKIGEDFRGDPASALLEVLDPEQNNSFSDHYLDVPFDLSRVIFIATGNILDPVPPALRDRMEVLELPGYTQNEKLLITQKYLIPRQTKEHGLSDANIEFTPAGVLRIITSYSKEAGLRNLEREIAGVCRKVATKVAEGITNKVTVTDQNIQEFLGPQKFIPEVAEKKDAIGVATGMAWTPMGGEILFIESSKMRGNKGLTLTGQLGDVMKESAQAALSYIRSHSQDLNIADDFFETMDIHVHVPAGAIPKDGPSAGVTMATSLVSLLSERAIKHDLAMTGEITLRGEVLPVGGIKEKVLAAHLAGIKTIILPKKNEGDLEDIPQEIREQVKFVLVDKLADVLQEALNPKVA